MLMGKLEHLDVYQVSCPVCGEPGGVAHPETGSLMWIELTGRVTATCTSCGATVRVPRKLRSQL
jgi:rRNA maturation protein Nop10